MRHKSTDWNKTRGGLDYLALPSGQYVTKHHARLDDYDVSVEDFIAEIESKSDQFIESPTVTHRSEYWDEDHYTVLSGERYCTPAEISKIESHIASVKKANDIAKERKASAELREYERLSKKFGEKK